MELSIVIVNYNVQHFLAQCLQSVQRACAGIIHEIFVVDNNSQDGSVAMMREKFPEVKLMTNTDNTGFSKANNQALAQAMGEYVLILNPDTVVAEDTITKCIAFMKQHSDAGALGVKMIDGKGKFLPESKRALPTPAVAFYKVFGLAALFPTTKTFGRYHLGFLSKDETHSVEILSGAFMFFRKAVLDKIGYFDETFFMYGEDIDLSYRVLLAGFRNYYVADTTIIHYKGESTKKGSLNYVRVFYEAMLIFARKHFAVTGANFFSVLIHVAVVLRAFLTLLMNVLQSAYLLLLDGALLFAGLYFLVSYWAINVKNAPAYFPSQFLTLIVPMYVVIWLSSCYFSGAYERPFKMGHVFRGLLFGTIIIATLYAFLPESWRFSRAIILLGAVWAAMALLATRMLHNLLAHGNFAFERNDDNNYLVLADEAETSRVCKILQAVQVSDEHVFSLSEKVNDLQPYLRALRITEIIFSSAQYSFAEIIAAIEKYGGKVNSKILNVGSDILIGSNSKNTAGDLLSAEVSFSLAKPLTLRKKRLLDILLCVLSVPVSFLFFQNWWVVLHGKKTWVGYWFTNDASVAGLPKILPAVIHAGKFCNSHFDESLIRQSNFLYAKNYRLSNDLRILWWWILDFI